MTSLKDQLLKAGLTNTDQVRKVTKQKQKQEKAARKEKGAGGITSVDIKKVRQVERDRELNRQKQEQANEKAIIAQIKQLVEMNRIKKDDGELVYNFVYNNKVKSMYVTDAIRAQLSLGRIAIVCYQESGLDIFELVPRGVANKIAERDASFLVPMTEVDESADTSDDPYAEFKVPDDLNWWAFSLDLMMLNMLSSKC